MTTIKRTRKQWLDHDAERLGLFVRTWSPGDGITRYRFFTNAKNSYHGPDNGIYTALGIKEAETFLAGYGR